MCYSGCPTCNVSDCIACVTVAVLRVISVTVLPVLQWLSYVQSEGNAKGGKSWSGLLLDVLLLASQQLNFTSVVLLFVSPLHLFLRLTCLPPPPPPLPPTPSFSLSLSVCLCFCLSVCAPPPPSLSLSLSPSLSLSLFFLTGHEFPCSFL